MRINLTLEGTAIVAWAGADSGSGRRRPAPLDDLDRRILSRLRDDGRISVSRLADAVHTSRATAYSRIQRLTELGVLSGFAATVDPIRSGTPVAAIVLVSAARPGQRRWLRWRDDIATIPSVEWAAMVAGDSDLVLLVRARDQEDLRQLLLERIQSLDYVGATRTLLVLDEIVHRSYVLPEG